MVCLKMWSIEVEVSLRVQRRDEFKIVKKEKEMFWTVCGGRDIDHIARALLSSFP